MKTPLRSPLPDDTVLLLSSHVVDDVFSFPLRNASSDNLGRWRKATLVLNAARRYRYISEQVELPRLLPRLRSTVHAVLAVDRFRKNLKQGSTPLLENGLPHSVQEVGATDLDVLARVFEAPTNADQLQAEEVERILRSLAQESNMPCLTAGDCGIEQQSPPQAMEPLLSRAHVMSSNNLNSPMLPHRFNPEHAITIPNDNRPPSSGGDTFDATMWGVDPMMALDNRATLSIAADPALTRQSPPAKAAILAVKTALAIALLSISATILLQGGIKGSSKILNGLFTIALLVTSLCSFLYILMEIFILFAVVRNTAWQDGNADTNSHPRTIRTISVVANLCFVVSVSALLIDIIVGFLSKLNSKQQINK